MRHIVRKMVEEALERCHKEFFHPAAKELQWTVEVPKKAEHGDYATNVALVVASRVKAKPLEVAQRLAKEISDPRGLVERVVVAPPGFINFFLNKERLLGVIKEVLQKGTFYGRSGLGRGTKVLIEFVSANPTGPLHIGHGRGAAIGAALANVLEAAGFDVTKEYYINDVGRQMEILGRSLYIRYLQQLGEKIVLPEDHYRGEYMIDLARELIGLRGDGLRRMDEAEAIKECSGFAAKRILDGIKRDLEDFRVYYDSWFHESSLYAQGKVKSHIDSLKAQGLIYEKDGALWFKSSIFGDEKDRVVVRSDGRTTYLASDIAYHAEKFERGFSRLVDIWGADHHGYVARMKGVIKALGKDPSSLDIILVQMVNLLRNGVPVAMSTRAGEFTTLREVIDEVGVDAARYIFLMRSSDSHLDFDLEVAKRQEKENPVYYVQYAHARICSIEREATERGIPMEGDEGVDLTVLKLPEEWELVKHLVSYPDVVLEAAKALEPHKLTFYLDDLASDFHAYYNRGWLEPEARVLCDNLEITRARLMLVKAIRQVLVNALTILGVQAPEQM